MTIKMRLQKIGKSRPVQAMKKVAQSPVVRYLVRVETLEYLAAAVALTATNPKIKSRAEEAVHVLRKSRGLLNEGASLIGQGEALKDKGVALVSEGQEMVGEGKKLLERAAKLLKAGHKFLVGLCHGRKPLESDAGEFGAVEGGRFMAHPTATTLGEIVRGLHGAFSQSSSEVQQAAARGLSAVLNNPEMVEQALGIEMDAPHPEYTAWTAAQVGVPQLDEIKKAPLQLTTGPCEVFAADE